MRVDVAVAFQLAERHFVGVLRVGAEAAITASGGCKLAQMLEFIFIHDKLLFVGVKVIVERLTHRSPCEQRVDSVGSGQGFQCQGKPQLAVIFIRLATGRRLD